MVGGGGVVDGRWRIFGGETKDKDNNFFLERDEIFHAKVIFLLFNWSK